MKIITLMISLSMTTEELSQIVYLTTNGADTIVTTLKDAMEYFPAGLTDALKESLLQTSRHWVFFIKGELQQ
jgi:hypothetical protein